MEIKSHSEKKTSLLPFPQSDLLAFQIDSFKALFYEKEEDKKKSFFWKILEKLFPVESKDGRFIVDATDYRIEGPFLPYSYCIENKLSYSASLYIKFTLKNVEDGEVVEKDFFMGDIPYLTKYATFVYNGVERVGLTQLKKTIGLSFFCGENKDVISEYVCRIIPETGSWIEFVTNTKELLFVCFDKKHKILLSSFLRALGYEKDIDIISIFSKPEKIKNNNKDLKKNIGKYLVLDVTKNNTDKKKTIAVKAGEVLNEENIKLIEETGEKEIFVLDKEAFAKTKYIINTLSKDKIKTKKEAQEYLFKSFVFQQKKTIKEEELEEFIKNKFGNEKNYSLGETGRQKFFSILGIKKENNILTKEDVAEISKAYISFLNGEKTYGDADNFCNKKLSTISEQLYDLLTGIFTKIRQQIIIKLNSIPDEKISIFELVNNFHFFSSINTFFATNPTMQFMDETSPLAEIMHKRRTTVIGVNGISRDSKTTTIRDLNSSQYGKVCPIETPEGENIGLVSSIAKNAQVEISGIIKSPYRKVKDGYIQIKEDVVYLDANEEVGKKIVRANIEYDDKGFIKDDFVVVRIDEKFKTVKREEVDYIEADPGQAFSLAASMIPFLENDEASRAMMGINMLKQAIPILGAEKPIVATGMEKEACKFCRRIDYAKKDGIVTYADAKKIVIEYNKEKDSIFSETETISLTKMRKSNQKTALNYTPLVKKGQKVKKGDPLTEGFATKDGELALGTNLVAAFMNWNGYNYEDAIVISDRLLKHDILTSIFVDRFETTTKETKNRKEETTKNLNNVTPETERNLNDDGIIKEGLYVKSGDILVGKTVPFSSQETSSPEIALLKKIFGSKAQATIDSCLTVPPFVQGTVIKTKVISKTQKKSARETRQEEEKLIVKYYEEMNSLFTKATEAMEGLVLGQKTKGIYMKDGSSFIKSKKLTEKDIERIFSYNDCLEEIGDENFNLCLLTSINPKNWFSDDLLNQKVESLIDDILKEQKKILYAFKAQKKMLTEKNVLPFDVSKLIEVTIAEKRKIKKGDKLSGRHGNKGVISKIVREEDMPFLADGTHVDIILTPLGIPSRMNIGQLYETILGLVGDKLNKRYFTPIFNGISFDEIKSEVEKAGLPSMCTMDVYDGQTGEKFENKITVGKIYMLKLNHMVDDKIHARATGKYSMLSQQPLKGRVNFGGQRFGEMEVWALEGYGAAYTLHELMTIKSDDVHGRKEVFTNIVYGKPIKLEGETESFNVLINEIRAMGLKITFGKKKNELSTKIFVDN